MQARTRKMVHFLPLLSISLPPSRYPLVSFWKRLFLISGTDCVLLHYKKIRFFLFLIVLMTLRINQRFSTLILIGVRYQVTYMTLCRPFNISERRGWGRCGTFSGINHVIFLYLYSPILFTCYYVRFVPLFICFFF